MRNRNAPARSRLFSSAVTSAVTVAAALLFAAPVVGDVTLEDIIENVRRNEALYDDLDVVVITDFEADPKTLPPPTDTWSSSLTSHSSTHSVHQAGLFRIDRSGENQTNVGAVPMDRTVAYDGETTKLYSERTIANLSQGRCDDAELVRPHTILSRKLLNQGVPLSVFLSGHDAIRSHPLGKLNEALTMRVALGGEVTHEGLLCRTVVVDVLKSSGEVHNRREFHLAIERNYLPLRVLAFTYHVSRDVPVGEGIVTNLLELIPGIWFPSHAEYTGYDQDLLKQEGRRQWTWRNHYTVETVSLDPKYPLDFFREVDFAPGTAVYEVEGGKITRSYRLGAPGAPGSPQRLVSRQWSVAVGVLVAILGVGSIVVAFKKRARQRDQV
ncbi:MAG TPA: hypothetical protein VMV69_29370 [Pirellulales bacterium]|nr:hypothetical protein [Pirellulales bacterium]